jgi:hypothetical protein
LPNNETNPKQISNHSPHCRDGMGGFNFNKMKNTKKLPKAFKDKWLKALRSGKFKQCQESLYDGEGYCCLGIACKIAYKNIPKWINDDYVLGEKGDTGEKRKIKNIPLVLLGDENHNPIVKELIRMNDKYGKSFKQIANYIEKNL